MKKLGVLKPAPFLLAASDGEVMTRARLSYVGNLGLQPLLPVVVRTWPPLGEGKYKDDSSLIEPMKILDEADLDVCSANKRSGLRGTSCKAILPKWVIENCTAVEAVSREMGFDPIE